MVFIQILPKIYDILMLVSMESVQHGPLLFAFAPLSTDDPMAGFAEDVAEIPGE